jgi:hypothetical protein
MVAHNLYGAAAVEIVPGYLTVILECLAGLGISGEA